MKPSKETMPPNAWRVYQLHRHLALVGAIGLVLVGIVGMYLLMSASARAGDATLSWTIPTRSQQCTVLDQTPDLATYEVWLLIRQIDDVTLEQTVFEGLEPGEYQYAMTATTSNGARSQLSNPASKTIDTFFAPAGSTVYQPTTISSGFWMIPAGTLPADTDCDVSVKVENGGNTYYRVPRESVQWSSGIEPQLVVAECG